MKKAWKSVPLNSRMFIKFKFSGMDTTIPDFFRINKSTASLLAFQTTDKNKKCCRYSIFG